MCGRYSLSSERLVELKLLFKAESLLTLERRYNIAPSQLAPIVRVAEGQREMILARWGLIPSWAKDAKVGFANINARAESVATKPAFRGAYKARRCIVPATGFYEWQGVAGQKRKQPHHIRSPQTDVLAMAGLWERWQHEGEVIDSFAIVTTESSGARAAIHDRMPVMLSPEGTETWLDPHATPEQLHDVLHAQPETLECFPVSTLVNKPQHDAPDCIAPIDLTRS